MDLQKIGPAKFDSDNYPEKLEQLVEGVKATGVSGQEDQISAAHPERSDDEFLRLGLRSTRDDPKAMSWGGQNVFDVYTKSTDKARDGTPYSEW